MSELDELRAELAELRALLPQQREIVPAWGERTCQACGEADTFMLADVIDLERPPNIPVQYWNGEGYCRKHGDTLGVTAADHPHMLRPGPPRKGT